MEPLALAALAATVGMLGAAGIITAGLLQAGRPAAAEDDALVARADAMRSTTSRDDPCRRCRGCHCEAWLRGADCGSQAAPKASVTLWSTTGRHAPAAVLAGVVPATWSPLAMRVRVALAPTWWTDRLGRPIQHGARVVVLP